MRRWSCRACRITVKGRDMTYIRESLAVPPLALAATMLALFALGSAASGPELGGILATSTAIVREVATHWIGANDHDE